MQSLGSQTELRLKGHTDHSPSLGDCWLNFLGVTAVIKSRLLTVTEDPLTACLHVPAIEVKRTAPPHAGDFCRRLQVLMAI